jgi:predicted DNA-binding protein with PD1-like motif
MLKLFLVTALVLLPAAAQETRREITSPPAPVDSKPNSDAVPAVYAVSTQFERVLMFRFKFDTDLLPAMEQMVKEHKVRNAVILSGAGSVRGYSVHQVSNRTFPSKNMIVSNPNAPADMVSMNGFIADGKIHAHLTLAQPDKAFAGHLHNDTKVFTFAVVTIGVLPDSLDMKQFDDKNYR